MNELRVDFRRRLSQLEDRVLRIGRESEQILLEATEALLEHRTDDAARVLSRDDEIDLATHEAEDQVHELIMLQAPVADELRLLLGLLQVIRSVERIGDYAVNIARLAELVDPVGEDDELAAQVRDMALAAQRAVRTSLDSFGQRRVDGVAMVEDVEQRLDLLHEGLTGRLMVHAPTSPETSSWAIPMIQVVRHLERVGDHAVRIAEQGAWVTTAQRRQPRPHA